MEQRFWRLLLQSVSAGWSNLFAVAHTQYKPRDSIKMSNAITLQHYQQIRHVDEIVEVAQDSWFVYRRSIKANGSLSIKRRVVFFGRSEEEVSRWLENQTTSAAYKTSLNP